VCSTVEQNSPVQFIQSSNSNKQQHKDAMDSNVVQQSRESAVSINDRSMEATKRIIVKEEWVEYMDSVHIKCLADHCFKVVGQIEATTSCIRVVIR
jgi:hypothetical protein